MRRLILCDISKDKNKEDISLANDSDYLKILELPDISDWVVFDSAGEKILDAKQYIKQNGEDLINM